MEKQTLVHLEYWDADGARNFNKEIVLPESAVVNTKKAAQLYAPDWAASCRVVITPVTYVESFEL
jgi:hypothetical protein